MVHPAQQAPDNIIVSICSSNPPSLFTAAVTRAQKERPEFLERHKEIVEQRPADGPRRLWVIEKAPLKSKRCWGIAIVGILVLVGVLVTVVHVLDDDFETPTDTDPETPVLDAFLTISSPYTTIGRVLQGQSAANGYGHAVSLDGKHMAVGAYESYASHGRVYAYEYAYQWSHLGDDVWQGDGPKSYLGDKVALHQDRLAVTLHRGDSHDVTVRQYEWGAWQSMGDLPLLESTVLEPMVPSIALFDDVLTVGRHATVQSFRYDGLFWNQEGTDILAPGLRSVDGRDGVLVVATANEATVYRWTNATWEQEWSVAQDNLVSVALANNTLAVAWLEEEAIRAQVYKYTNDVEWLASGDVMETYKTLNEQDQYLQDRYVTLSDNGETVALLGDDLIVVENSTEVARTFAGDYKINSMSLSGNRLAIGYERMIKSYYGSGHVQVFERQE